MKKNDINTNPVFKTPAEYVKLQDAYIAEKGDTVSVFADIGYEMGSTNSFTYSDKITTKAALSSETAAWEAKSNVALNDCAKESTWTLKVAASATGNGAAWTVAISDAKCKVLTPQFESLQRGTAKSGGTDNANTNTNTGTGDGG